MPNRTRKNLNSYVGLAVTAYNLHKIGRKLIEERIEEDKKQKSLRKAAQSKSWAVLTLIEGERYVRFMLNPALFPTLYAIETDHSDRTGQKASSKCKK